jgi:hypothetical protein
MRKIAAALVLATALGLLAPGAATARVGEEEIQTQAGSVLLPTRFTDGEGGFPGLARRLWNHAEQTNGLVGYVFEIQRETWMGRFELSVVSQQNPPGDADLGIYFYNHDLGDGANATATSTAEYDARRPGGETGFIPPDTHWAIVFMSRGVNVGFSYRGFSPMSVEISDTGFTPSEVNVKSGAWVVWENVGQQFHSVTEQAAKPTFDSSPTPNKPLVPGATFAVRFTKVGTVTYFDRYGTATGIVRVESGPGEGTPGG